MTCITTPCLSNTIVFFENELAVALKKCTLGVIGGICYLNPLFIPIGTISYGMCHLIDNDYASKVLKYFEKCEQEYIQLHPFCLKSEAFDYAKKETEIFKEKLGFTTDSDGY